MFADLPGGTWDILETTVRDRVKQNIAKIFQTYAKNVITKLAIDGASIIVEQL